MTCDGRRLRTLRRRCPSDGLGSVDVFTSRVSLARCTRRFRFAEMCGCRQRTAVTPHRVKYDQVGDRIDAGKTDSCSRLGTEIFSGECPVFLNEGSVMQ